MWWILKPVKGHGLRLKPVKVKLTFQESLGIWIINKHMCMMSVIKDVISNETNVQKLTDMKTNRCSHKRAVIHYIHMVTPLYSLLSFSHTK